MLPITQANATTCVAPEARSVPVGGDGAEELFLGGQFIELGIGNLGSFGTSEPAPAPSQSPSATDFYQKAGFEPRVGMRADFDGFCSGTDHVVDFFMPGEPYEAYGIGIKTADAEYFQFVSTLSEDAAGSGNMLAVGPGDVVITDMSDAGNGTLQAKIETTFKKADGSDLALLTQTISFQFGDKEYDTDVVIKNLTDAEWEDVRYARSVDPDNTMFSPNGSYGTKNLIVDDTIGGESLLIRAQALDTDQSEVSLASADPIKLDYISYDLGAFGTVAPPAFGGINPFSALVNRIGDESVPDGFGDNDWNMQITIAIGGVFDPNDGTLTPGSLSANGTTDLVSMTTSLENTVSSVDPADPDLIQTRIVKPPLDRNTLVPGVGGSFPSPANLDESESIGKLGPGEGVEFTLADYGDFNDALFLDGVLLGSGPYGSHPVPFAYEQILEWAQSEDVNVCVEQTLTYRLYEGPVVLEFFPDFFDTLFLDSASVQLLPDPSCATVSPDFGTTAGGTAITISGADFDFDANSTVTVDGVACTSITVISPTEIECVTPAGINGVVDIEVTDVTDTTVIADAFNYTEPCSASSSNIMTSAGLFNLGGVELCFDQGADPNDIILSQLSGRDNFGAEVPEGWSFDYEDVAVGADKTLNAFLTVSVVNKLLDNVAHRVDRFRASRGFGNSNKWIQSRIYYLALEQGDEDDRYVEYTLVFYDKSDPQKTPVTVSNLSTTVYDIDAYQFFESTNVESYLLSLDTFLTASRLGDGSVRIAEMDGDGSDPEDDFARVTFKLANSNQFKFKLGISSLEEEPDGNATFGLDFSGGPAWDVTPEENSVTQVNNNQVNNNPGPAVTFRSVSFDANGGTGTALSVSAYTSTALPPHSLVRPGFTFNGWNTKADGSGVSYADQGTHPFDTDVILYAQWVPVKVEVKIKKYISTFAADKAVLTKNMRTQIAAWVKKLPKDSTITCQGSTSGSKVTAFDRRLASNRAKNVCVEATRLRSDLTYLLKLNPSSATKVSARHVWMIQN